MDQTSCQRKVNSQVGVGSGRRVGDVDVEVEAHEFLPIGVAAILRLGTTAGGSRTMAVVGF